MSTNTVSVTSTLAMVLAAQDRGVETTPLLDQAGLRMALLEAPSERLSLTVALSLWDGLRDRSNDPTLQLAAPMSLPYGAYRVLEYLVGSSATVGDGVRRFARYFRLITPQVALDVESGPHESSMSASLAGGGAVPPIYVDYIFAALIGRVRMRPRPDLRVARVEFRRPEPPYAGSYEEVLRAPIRFGAGKDRVCFVRGEWEKALATRDATLADILDEQARARSEVVTDWRGHFAGQVRDAIVKMLPDGAPVEAVSRFLGVSARTLQRRLADADTTYSGLLDDARRGLAETYLSDRRTSIGEVAFLLGFSDPSTFHRAFVRWTGEAPGRFRRRITA